MTQFCRGLTQPCTLLLLLYDSQEMRVTLVEKPITAESGYLMQKPTAHDGACHDSSAYSSGPAGILSTAQTIEKS